MSTEPETLIWVDETDLPAETRALFDADIPLPAGTTLFTESLDPLWFLLSSSGSSYYCLLLVLLCSSMMSPWSSSASSFDLSSSLHIWVKNRNSLVTWYFAFVEALLDLFSH